MKQPLLRRAPYLFIPFALWGCDGDAPISTSGGVGAAGVEAGEVVTSGTEAGTEAGVESGTEAGTEAGVESGTEAGVMAGTEAGVMAGTDAGVEAGVEAGTEAGVMAGTEAGVMAGTEAGVMAGTEAGIEAGTEAGTMQMVDFSMPQPGYDELTEPQRHMGAVAEGGASEHLFYLSEASYVVMFTSDGVQDENGVYGCPAGEDTMLRLYQLTATGRELIASNDDGGTGLCSRLQEQLEVGNYVVEVVGFAERAVGSYVLDIFIAPLLLEGESCDADDATLGLCDEGLACSAEGVCINAAPVISEAVAYQRDNELFVTLSGVDPDGDAAYLDLWLYDADLNELDGDFRTVQRGVEGAFTARYTSDFFDLTLATQVGLIVSDRGFNESQELIVPLTPHPTLVAGDSCELERFTGQCDAGLICAPDESDATQRVCSQGVAPVAHQGLAYSDGGVLALMVEGSDDNGDVALIELGLYDETGALLDLGGNQHIAISVAEVRPAQDPTHLRHFARFLNLGDYPEAVAADLKLIDASGLVSNSVLALIAPLPVSAIGEACDLDRFESSCGPFVCAFNVEAPGEGVCLESLPAEREPCSVEVGCAEGLLCYSIENGGGISVLYGTCFRVCDENGVEQGGEVGCEVGERCVPDVPWREYGLTEIPSPGFCLPQDSCTPSDTSMCGEGEFFCRREGELSTCIDLAPLTEFDHAASGEACDNFNTICDAGLACEYEQCRASCTDSSSCAEGESCLTISEGNSFCAPTCDLFAQDCPNNEVCALRESTATQVIALCEAGSSRGTLTQGEVCDPTAVEVPGYWGECVGNAVCADVTRAGERSCYEMCTSDNNTCEGDLACLDVMLQDEGVGLCFNECSPFTNVGCDPTQSCLLVGQGQNSAGEEKIVGLCRDNPNPGSVAQGGACVFDGASSTNNCLPGHLCADIYGTGDECVALCQIDEAGALVVPCGGAQTCLYEQLGQPIFEEMPRLGVCID